jgi:uncharacterized membrane protein
MLSMSNLIAIGYRDETTAAAAADEARRLAKDLVIHADAIAWIRRDAEGKYHVSTTHHAVGAGAVCGMFWGLLFGAIVFVPVFGLALGGGFGALMGKVTKTRMDNEFQDRTGDMVKPGSSALFVVVDMVAPDKAVEAMSRFGGTVLKSSLSKDAERQCQADLHGTTPGAVRNS